MMKHEFEQIAGYKVSDRDYNEIIEPMYMTVNLSKVDFEKTINRKRFEIKPEKDPEIIALEKDLKKQIQDAKKSIEWYRERIETFSELYSEDGNVFWKDGIERFKAAIVREKNRIHDLNFVLKA